MLCNCCIIAVYFQVVYQLVVTTPSSVGHLSRAVRELITAKLLYNHNSTWPQRVWNRTVLVVNICTQPLWWKSPNLRKLKRKQIITRLVKCHVATYYEANSQSYFNYRRPIMSCLWDFNTLFLEFSQQMPKGLSSFQKPLLEWTTGHELTLAPSYC